VVNNAYYLTQKYDHKRLIQPKLDTPLVYHTASISAKAQFSTTTIKLK